MRSGNDDLNHNVPEPQTSKKKVNIHSKEAAPSAEDDDDNGGGGMRLQANEKDESHKNT